LRLALSANQPTIFAIDKDADGALFGERSVVAFST